MKRWKFILLISILLCLGLSISFLFLSPSALLFFSFLLNLLFNKKFLHLLFFTLHSFSFVFLSLKLLFFENYFIPSCALHLFSECVLLQYPCSCLLCDFYVYIKIYWMPHLSTVIAYREFLMMFGKTFEEFRSKSLFTEGYGKIRFFLLCSDYFPWYFLGNPWLRPEKRVFDEFWFFSLFIFWTFQVFLPK